MKVSTMEFTFIASFPTSWYNSAARMRVTGAEIVAFRPCRNALMASWRTKDPFSPYAGTGGPEDGSFTNLATNQEEKRFNGGNIQDELWKALGKRPPYGICSNKAVRIAGPKHMIWIDMVGSGIQLHTELPLMEDSLCPGLVPRTKIPSSIQLNYAELTKQTHSLRYIGSSYDIFLMAHLWSFM